MSDYIPEYKKRAEQVKALKQDNSVAWVDEKDPIKAGKSVCQVVQTLTTDQQTRMWDAARQMSMYANADLMQGYGNTSVAMPKLTYNLVKVCTDTLVGLLIQSNSRIVMNTARGNWNDRKKARHIELAIEGEWSRMRFYREAAYCAIDAITSGTGFLKLYTDKDKVACERIFPNEVLVDEAEAAYGPPQKMFQKRYLKKDTLIRLYPDKADIIAKAATERPLNYPWLAQANAQLVQVCEAWSLGRRHIIAVDSGCLVDEPWPHNTFPIISFRAGLRPFGWYGQGFCEQVFETQLVLNETIAVMQQAAALGITPYWVIQEGSSISPRHLSNEIGHVVETNSIDPKWVTNPPFHPDATTYVEQLAQIIYNFYGLNQMQTQGEVQTNRLDSRKALIEFQDIAATRHTALLERWEDFFIEAAKSTVSLCQQIAKRKGGYPVVAKEKYQVSIHLDWKELDLDANAHVFTPAPSNLLSRTVAGKLNEINEMMQSGLINQAQGQRALRGAPDVDALVSESTALDDHIDYVIAQIVDKDVLIPPDTFTISPHTVNRMRNARLEYVGREAPQYIIAMFDSWISQATDFLERKAADEQAKQQAAANLQGALDAGAANSATTSPTASAGEPSQGGESSAGGISSPIA